jgi:hypothetical protein
LIPIELTGTAGTLVAAFFTPKVPKAAAEEIRVNDKTAFILTDF